MCTSALMNKLYCMRMVATGKSGTGSGSGVVVAVTYTPPWRESVAIPPHFCSHTGGIRGMFLCLQCELCRNCKFIHAPIWIDSDANVNWDKHFNHHDCRVVMNSFPMMWIVSCRLQICSRTISQHVWRPMWAMIDGDVPSPSLHSSLKMWIRLHPHDMN